MGKYDDAALQLGRQAVKYDALMAAAKSLREIGAFKNAAVEQRRAAEDANKALIDANASMEKVIADKKAIEAECVAKRKEADLQYTSELSDAKNKADEITGQAQREADALIAEAQRKAEKAVDDVQKRINNARAELAAMDAELSATTEVRNKVRAEADAQEKRLKKIKEDIAKLAAS